MERNYDELIAEMLMSIDRHTEELTKQSLEMTKHSLEMTRHSQELAAIRSSQEKNMEAMLRKFKDMEQIDSNLLQQLVQSATILDRIIKKNDLRL